MSKNRSPYLCGLSMPPPCRALVYQTETETETETERQRDRETERQRDRNTERQSERQGDKDRETERQGDRDLQAGLMALPVVLRKLSLIRPEHLRREARRQVPAAPSARGLV